MWKRARHQQRPVWETDEDETESSSSDDDSDDEDEHECLYKSLEAQLKRLLQLPWLAQRQKPPLSAEVLEGAHEQLHVVAAEIHGLRTAANAIPDIRGVTALRAAADMLEDRLEQVTGLCAEQKQQQQQEEREAVGRAACLEILDAAATEADMSIDRIMLLGAAPTANVAFLNELLSRCDECNSFVGRVWALFGVYAVENVKNWRALFPWLVQQAKRKSWPEWSGM
ncbi:hypothetical protein JKP88DRAFT_277707 [Tribonema minus]|uniref:Uncharacterized protein n=1 Tax=Tribonema minus TaxID=303371 RepID=A0A835YZ55_9STRA|nr:hypothetical protein JKP88DRAFT_277707 [Tribonema minus]